MYVHFIPNLQYTLVLPDSFSVFGTRCASSPSNQICYSNKATDALSYPRVAPDLPW